MNSTNYWKLGAFVLGGIALAFAVLVAAGGLGRLRILRRG